MKRWNASCITRRASLRPWTSSLYACVEPLSHPLSPPFLPLVSRNNENNAGWSSAGADRQSPAPRQNHRHHRHHLPSPPRVSIHPWAWKVKEWVGGARSRPNVFIHFSISFLYPRIYIVRINLDWNNNNNRYIVSYNIRIRKLKRKSNFSIRGWRLEIVVEDRKEKEVAALIILFWIERAVGRAF